MEKSEEIDFLNTLLPLSLVLFIITLGVVLLNQQFNKKLYRQQLKHEALKIKSQQDLLRSSIEAQEEERKRIARDLHDEMGALLSLARMQLLQLERQPCDPPVTTAKLAEIRSVTESALASMRRISHLLLPPQLTTFGLVQTLQSLRQQVQTANGPELTISADPDFPRLDAAVELGLYRVCLELIQNTLKHAGAGNIHLQLNNNPAFITLTYTDDGCGLPTTTPNSGLGIKNTEARIQALNGQMERGNRPENGMFVTIQIPINHGN